mmetsp:Transcript_24010/g.37082  ORF Transcript_24010/g.37082 Transcript_24010/m.37082 type:complete len:333 (-) Transcript_24010:266-1264(-)|eukprot:CAMPEP_0195296026 /NCGR_PEP_ID=MMETSP0707-20130614/18641_1 /TAXON_ID=33640 /ORGANISM="Asterionellopsis glacialis, Strain CCMP134" /LENGTH=332 /DNA_ID=CAMNT_0040357407 /DNA_START=139 /DNA_END=1137 /DNA_ORIENTATION=+
MCQLLGMNCADKTDFGFSFRGFCQRGGCTDIHSHGWGLCSYEGAGLRSFHDTLPAYQSPLASLVSNYPMKTHNMIAHVRYATQGAVNLENVHPFSREMWGIQWCFAHNGDVPKYSSMDNFQNHLLGNTPVGKKTFNPVGDTDSEAVFCAILNALNAEFDQLPTLQVLHETLKRLCDEILRGRQQETIFNFLLGCGQYTLFAYSWPGRRPGSQVWNGLYYIVRQPPFSTAQLVDIDYSIDFAKQNIPTDRIAVITTKPLTHEKDWKEMKRGELIMFDKGLPYRAPSECEAVERQGRGLLSKSFGKSPLLKPHAGDLSTVLKSNAAEGIFQLNG